MIQVINKTSDTLIFGKYKGKTVLDVLDENAQYLLWCATNSIIGLSKELEESVKRVSDTQRRDYLDSMDNWAYPSDDDWGDRD